MNRFQQRDLNQNLFGRRVLQPAFAIAEDIHDARQTIGRGELRLIADRSKVTHDKVGQVAQLGVGALAGGDLFRDNQFEWMEKILLPKLAAKGITEKNQILDTIGGLFYVRTASNLFA